MDPKSEGDFLSKICCLVFQRRNRNLIRDCQEGLLKSVIYNAGNPGMDVHDLSQRIREEINSKGFPEPLIKRILETLREKGEVFKEGDKYFLEKDVFEKIAMIVKKRKEILERAKAEIVAEVKKESITGITEVQAALEAFQNFISDFLVAESNFIADVLSCRSVVHEIFSPKEVLDNVLSEVEDENLKESIRRSLVETFKSQNREFIRLLYEAALNLICLRILSMDPSGAFWKKENLAGKTFILDTNVLFAFLLPDHPQHAVTNEIVSTARNLGVKNVFTKRTMQEWLEVLEKADQRFRFLNSTRPSLLGKVEDIFIYSYFKRREAVPSLTWHEYYSKMRQVEDLARFSGIQLYEEKEEYTSDAEGLKIMEHLSEEVYRSGRRRLDARFIKSRRVSEHDAYHLLLVRRMREEFPSKSLGPSCWFLTYDVSLLEADKMLNRLLKSPHATPSSLLVDTWVLMASLFVDDRAEKEKLAEIFAILFMNHFVTPPRKISASMIVEVLSPYLSYRSLSDDAMQKGIGQYTIKCVNE